MRRTVVFWLFGGTFDRAARRVPYRDVTLIEDDVKLHGSSKCETVRSTNIEHSQTYNRFYQVLKDKYLKICQIGYHGNSHKLEGLYFDVTLSAWVPFLESSHLPGKFMLDTLFGLGCK